MLITENGIILQAWAKMETLYLDTELEWDDLVFYDIGDLISTGNSNNYPQERENIKIINIIPSNNGIFFHIRFEKIYSETVAYATVLEKKEFTIFVK
jgi:hypothetical protein